MQYRIHPLVPLAALVLSAAPASAQEAAVPAAPLPADAPPPVPVVPPPAPDAPEVAPEVAPETTSEDAVADTTAAEDPVPQEAMGEVIEMVARTLPGSAQAVGAEDLERFEHDDVHQVLGSVPGVYIREEEGYGLRPNIGMRGAASERSAKIVLMEDGVLIAPAPYAAPAAYYFPLLTRMERVEVVKGPGSIQYGPNTVGGSINMISQRVPRRGHQALLDAALGQTLYSKLHARYGAGSEHVGILVEGVKLRSDGFKQLDGGGNTGFDKNDAQLKLRLSSDSARSIYHQLDLKVGYADEVSNETYTGLSDADFAATPYRRYAATARDRMEWDHVRMQLGHQVDIAGHVRLTTTLYRNQFSRDWGKLSGFAGSALEDILANPDTGANAIYYQILTGQADTTVAEEELIVGTNARDFVSQGAQLVAQAERRVLGLRHQLDAGLRYHQDRAERFHFEDRYRMMDGDLAATGAARAVTLDAVGQARAWAAYVQDQVRIADVTVTAGVRAERIRNRWTDAMRPEQDRSSTYVELIPGAGVVYQVLPSLGLLAGLHKGFAPVAPGSDPSTQPEQSVNYEAGLRYAEAAAHAEVIGFFSDYSNLKGTCSFSSGCAADQVDREFNGGAVDVVGLEALGAAELRAGRLRIPLQGSYTFTRSRFQQSFTSDNPQWGDVQAGDEMPYLPAHQLSVQAGVGGTRWEVAAAGRYVSAMRDVAGQGEPDARARTDAHLVLDLAAHVDFGVWGNVYLTVDNILDQAHVVSRRPYGVRPGKPRLAILGYKYHF